jgi:hypothetical protein
MKNDGPTQIEVLKTLHPLAVGWLVDRSVRTIRDASDLPRQENGRIDARAVLAWAGRRQPGPKLDNHHQEQLLVLASYFAGEVFSASAAREIVAFADALTARFGDSALIVIARALLDACRKEAEQYELPAQVTEAEVRAELQQRRNAVAWEQLRHAVTCERCGRLRRGSTWIKAESPAGYVVTTDICPECSARYAPE